MPFFSVIIPTYNRSNFIVATITSVLEQNFEDFEVLVIDDGSTDNTKEIIERILQKDKRVKYFYKTNAERGAARNFGVQESNGKFLIFLDSDDLFLPFHLQNLEKIIFQNPKINFFASKFDFLENNIVFKSPINNIPDGRIDYTLLIKGNPFACNVCIKKNNDCLSLFLEETKYSGMEDWIFLFTNTWSQDLFLYNQTTVRMNEHPNRSMRFNKIIIEKRIEATNYLLKNFGLTKNEKKKISGYTAYFCAIHTYLDNDRKTSIKWMLKAMRYLGFRSDLLSLIIKLVFGRKIIGKLKEVIHHK